MAKNNLIAAFEAELDHKEKELLAQRSAVRNFVATPHTAKETKEAQTQVGKTESEVSAILQSLLEAKEVSAEFKAEAESLCQRCRELNNYTRDMNQALSGDLVEKYHLEEKKRIDVIKNITFLIAVPAAFVTAVKNGLGDSLVNVYQAAGAGLIVSSSILSRKKITKAFKEAGRAVYETPRQMRGSFLVYYAREVAKEKMAATKSTYRNVAGFLNARTSVAASRAKGFSAKLRSIRTPRG